MANTTRDDDPQLVTDVSERGPAMEVVADGDRAGLSLKRYFTRDGVHPYDELEWELRDAVLTNWRDGTTSTTEREVAR